MNRWSRPRCFCASRQVAGKLEEMNLEVLSVGSRSISVQGTKERFESVFGCRLVSPEERTSPAKDFGPLGEELAFALSNHPGFRSSCGMKSNRSRSSSLRSCSEALKRGLRVAH
jgi:hypothetical protein